MSGFGVLTAQFSCCSLPAPPSLRCGQSLLEPPGAAWKPWPRQRVQMPSLRVQVEAAFCQHCAEDADLQALLREPVGCSWMLIKQGGLVCTLHPAVLSAVALGSSTMSPSVDVWGWDGVMAEMCLECRFLLMEGVPLCPSPIHPASAGVP